MQLIPHQPTPQRHTTVYVKATTSRPIFTHFSNNCHPSSSSSAADVLLLLLLLVVVPLAKHSSILAGVNEINQHSQ